MGIPSSTNTSAYRLRTRHRETRRRSRIWPVLPACPSRSTATDLHTSAPPALNAGHNGDDCDLSFREAAQETQRAIFLRRPAFDTDVCLPLELHRWLYEH